MGRIHQLDMITANGIAAGEVVERPSSVVKELLENAMDAGASVITIEIENGGITLIRVTDDGCGMDEDDAKLSFIVHATSKMNQLEDLYTLNTMGFRGEALSSIAAVSRVRLKTKQPGDEKGTEVVIHAGEVQSVSSVGTQTGTVVEVRDLFFNLPARYKFLKKDSTEAQYIITLCERFALLRPDISFRLLSQKKEILHTPGNNDPESTLYSIYGKEIVNSTLYSDETIGDVRVRGFIGKPDIAKSNRAAQIIFVNDRLIRAKTITAAIDEAYKTMLMKGRYAFVVLFIYIPPQLLDVNVHPQKAEVRFWNENEVFRSVFHIIQNALLSNEHVSDFSGFSDQTRTDNTQKEEAINRPDTELLKNDAFSKIEGISDSDSETSKIPGKTDEIEPVKKKVQERSFPIQETIPEYETAVDTNRNLNNEAKESDSDSFEILSEQEKNRKNLGLEFTITDILKGRVVGVVFATYILIEMKDYLVLLDQHAAHEKILFEKLMKKKENDEKLSISIQTLLAPEMITLTPADTHFLSEEEEKLKKTGFDFAFIGDREIGLRGIPAVKSSANPRELFLTALDLMKKNIPETDEQILLILATSACKAAVKGHDHLHEEEISKLLEDLSLLKNPYHCPHGRPILIKLSQKELEKEFKRIV